MRIKALSTFLWAIVLFSCFAVCPISASDDCDSIAIERAVPEEIESAVQGIIVFNRQLGTYRTLQIGDYPSVILGSSQNLGDARLLQSTTLSYGKTQILSVYRNSTGQTILALNPITANSVASEGIVDDLNGLSPFLYWLNTDTVIATDVDDENHIYKYVKISTSSFATETVEINISDWLADPVRISLSPDESRLAYTRYSTTSANDVVEELAIMDTQHGVSVKALTGPGIDSIYGIRWSPLGTYVLVMVIDRTATQLQVFDRNAQRMSSIGIHHDLMIPPEWSPDEKFVLYNNLTSQNNSYPSFLNVQSGELKSLCLDGQGFWSPDSRYLGVVEHKPYEEGMQREVSGIFVYDIAENKLYQLEATHLEDIGSVLGWGVPPQ